MSSFRVNKEPTERNSRKYGPPLRDSELQGPSTYSTFIAKSPPPDGDNKLVLANGGTLPYIAAYYSTPTSAVNDKDSYSINVVANTYVLNFIERINGTTLLPTPLFGNDTTFTIPTLVVTPTTANTTASFTYNPVNKTFGITLTNSTGTPTTGTFNFIAFASS